MFIRNCLTEFSALTVVTPDNTVSDVLQKMSGHLSLPCVDHENTFIGMISKRTIFEVFQHAFQQGQTDFASFLGTSVEACINRSVPTLTLNSHFEDTIEIIIQYPFVPIVEDGKLLGIVKRGDVNTALTVAFATHVESTRIHLAMPEVEGALHHLFTITHRLGVNVITAVPFDAGPQALNRRLILKISKTSELDELIQQLERTGFHIIEVTK